MTRSGLVALVTLCGFGPSTGSRILAEIVDPTRFKDGGRLAACAGLAPRRQTIRQIDQQRQRITPREPSTEERNVLAAFVATQHDPHAKAYYQRKRDEGKNHNAAAICVARRRCDLIHAMLTTATPYDPQRAENLAPAA